MSAENLTYTVDGAVMSALEYIDYLHQQLSAVAPSDAKGKADAANAGVQWISVKDRLPATEHECTSRDLMVSNSFYVRGIAADGGEGFGLADYQEDGKWHCYGGDYDFMHLAEVTHYLPIRSTATSAADEKDAAQWRDLLQCVMREMPQRFHHDDGNAPGHDHSKPGIWDQYNGAKSGTECAWCKVWNTARKELERAAMAAAPSSEKGNAK